MFRKFEFVIESVDDEKENLRRFWVEVYRLSATCFPLKEEKTMTGGYKLLEEEAKRLERDFTYHAPKGTQSQRYEELRGKAKEFAELILLSCPNSRERALAITKIEESIFWANSSIARGE